MDIQKLDQQYILPTYARREIVFEHGAGSKLYDAKGREYIDFTSGIGVNCLGHGNTKLAVAIASQATRMIHCSNLYLVKNQAIAAEKLAKLCEKAMGGAPKIFFANSGAEANECAIKLARKWGEPRGKFEIITLRNSFHGRTIATLAATAQDKFHEHFAPFPAGFVYAENLAQVRELITEKTAAVMIEPIQGEGGIAPLDFAELKSLSEFLARRELLLIADEIQCGVFRSGKFMACELSGAKPQIATFAKALAGGVPIGACAATLDGVFASGDHGSTFGGNPLSTAAMNAVLEVLESHFKSGALASAIKSFDAELKTLLSDYKSLFTASCGVGLMRSLVAKTPEIQKQIIDAAHDRGVLVLRAGADHIRFLPPLTIADLEIHEGFSRLSAACEFVSA
jgi:acetylornithine aminotransferase